MADQPAGAERRSNVRKNMVLQLKLCHATGEELGHVIDLSAEGALVVHQTPLKQGETLSVHLQLPQPLTEGGTIQFDCICRWTARDARDDYLKSGLQLLNVSMDKLRLIDQLIQRFSFEGGGVFDRGDDEAVNS